MFFTLSDNVINDVLIFISWYRINLDIYFNNFENPFLRSPFHNYLHANMDSNLRFFKHFINCVILILIKAILIEIFDFGNFSILFNDLFKYFMYHCSVKQYEFTLRVLHDIINFIFYCLGVHLTFDFNSFK